MCYAIMFRSDVHAEILLSWNLCMAVILVDQRLPAPFVANQAHIVFINLSTTDTPALYRERYNMRSTPH